MTIKLRSDNSGNTTISIKAGRREINRIVTRYWTDFELPTPPDGIFTIELFIPNKTVTFKDANVFRILFVNVSGNIFLNCDSQDGPCSEFREKMTLSKVGSYMIRLKAEGKKIC